MEIIDKLNKIFEIDEGFKRRIRDKFVRDIESAFPNITVSSPRSKMLEVQIVYGYLNDNKNSSHLIVDFSDLNIDPNINSVRVQEISKNKTIINEKLLKTNNIEKVIIGILTQRTMR